TWCAFRSASSMSMTSSPISNRPSQRPDHDWVGRGRQSPARLLWLVRQAVAGCVSRHRRARAGPVTLSHGGLAMAQMHVISGVGNKLDMPVIEKIGISDLMLALRRGAEDFWAKPSHYFLLALIYPIVGIVLTVWMNGFYTWSLLYPLIGGFALLGPVAALPL